MLSYLRYEILSRRSAILGWTIGVTAFVVIYSAFYPTMPEEMLNMPLDNDLYKAVGGFEMATFAGYFSTTILNFMTVLLGIFAVTNGTATLAGEEDEGFLELQATLPLRRWQIVLSKALAMVAGSLFALTVAGGGAAFILTAIKGQIETDLTALDMFTVVFAAWPIIFLFMMSSLFCGAFFPNRRTAASAATFIFVGIFFGSNLADIVDGLKPIEPFLPYSYFDRSTALFSDGMAAGDIAVLVGVGLIFLLLALLSFSRRNLTTGAWPFTRPRPTA